MCNFLSQGCELSLKEELTYMKGMRLDWIINDGCSCNCDVAVYHTINLGVVDEYLKTLGIMGTVR